MTAGRCDPPALERPQPGLFVGGRWTWGMEWAPRRRSAPTDPYPTAGAWWHGRATPPPASGGEACGVFIGNTNLFRNSRRHSCAPSPPGFTPDLLVCTLRLGGLRARRPRARAQHLLLNGISADRHQRLAGGETGFALPAAGHGLPALPRDPSRWCSSIIQIAVVAQAHSLAGGAPAPGSGRLFFGPLISPQPRHRPVAGAGPPRRSALGNVVVAGLALPAGPRLISFPVRFRTRIPTEAEGTYDDGDFRGHPRRVPHLRQRTELAISASPRVPPEGSSSATTAAAAAAPRPSGVSFTLRDGDRLGLVGGNGAGKIHAELQALVHAAGQRRGAGEGQDHLASPSAG